MIVEAVKQLWRPLIGGGVVAAYVRAAFVDPAAAEVLQVPATTVLAFYFLERAITHARNGD